MIPKVWQPSSTPGVPETFAGSLQNYFLNNTKVLPLSLYWHLHWMQKNGITSVQIKTLGPDNTSSFFYSSLAGFWFFVIPESLKNILNRTVKFIKVLNLNPGIHISVPCGAVRSAHRAFLLVGAPFTFPQWSFHNMCKPSHRAVDLQLTQRCMSLPSQ